MVAVNPLYQDRRQLTRFAASELAVSIRPRRRWPRKWWHAQASDFTRTGLCLVTDLDLKKGQQVHLKIILRLNRSEVHQNGVIATVRNKQSDGDGFRYGLLFDYEASRRMRSMKTRARLGRIEGILDRMESLKARTLPESALYRQHPDTSGTDDSDR